MATTVKTAAEHSVMITDLNNWRIKVK
jgi:hypothetical protein